MLVCVPAVPAKVQQRKQMLLRKRYWLYYALTFLSGARRQIFVVFAGFLLVQKFGFDVGTITALFLVNAVINIFLAPVIGKAIARFGERRALIFEYLGLIGVFVAYALVESGTVAAVLYVVDHLFFALAIAMRTYFQKIADPADIAATAGVSFRLITSRPYCCSCVRAVVAGVASAGVPVRRAAGNHVLALSILVPDDPREGNEV